MSKKIKQEDLDRIEIELEDLIEDLIDDLADKNSSMIETHKDKVREKIEKLTDRLKDEFPFEDGDILEAMVKDRMSSVMNNSMLVVLENDWYQSLRDMI